MDYSAHPSLITLQCMGKGRGLDMSDSSSSPSASNWARGEVAQRVKALSTGDLSLVPRTHMVEGKDQFPQCPVISIHALSRGCMHMWVRVYTHAQNENENNKTLRLGLER